MKALDLQIFEKHPDVDAYRFGPSFTPYAIVAVEKRFTDAELASEYWRMEAVVADLGARSKHGDVKASDILMAQDDLETLERFATLPHYDEQ